MSTQSTKTTTVIKRDGSKQPIDQTKITIRLQKLADIDPKLSNVDLKKVTSTVVERIYDGITTTELDSLAARTCASKITTSVQYDDLAARITVSDLHKRVTGSFVEVTRRLRKHGLVNEAYAKFVEANAKQLNAVHTPARDYKLKYFGLKTLTKGYLHVVDSQLLERPCDMWLRVACGIHGVGESPSLEKAINSYQLMSRGYFTHATPTLFHAGGEHPQLLSCFLMGTEDSVDGIFKTITDCAKISKYAGGIGVHCNNIRANGSLIKGTNGKSSGVVPMLRTYESTALYINQAGRRNGSFAMYMSPWHADFMDFVKMKRNVGDEHSRARDLFYGAWIHDLFMRAVEKDQDWHVFCPNDVPELDTTWGKDFEDAYQAAVDAGLSRKKYKAREVWKELITTQIETGMPYILYADAANRKTNQQNIGTIKSSNLCSEILEYSDDKETACCTLASIGLPMFVKDSPSVRDLRFRSPFTVNAPNREEDRNLWKALLNYHKLRFSFVDDNKNEMRDSDGELVGTYKEVRELLRPTFDFNELRYVVHTAVDNLDQVVDINYYPTKETQLSNDKHRPLGLGVQGLNDVFNRIGHAFDSDEAMLLNKQIFATIYYAAVEKSIHLAKDKGPYSSFQGSPISKGQLQFDMAGVKPLDQVPGLVLDWDTLRADIKKHGVRNSLLLALMPTASTGQILGNTEAIEPVTSHLYTRQTRVGNFVVLNRELHKVLDAMGLWSKDMKDRIILNGGSIVGLHDIPQEIQDRFKNAWDLSMKCVLRQSADRGAYICQSQSLNLFVRRPTMKILSSMHFYSWKLGLKTGMYYLRSNAPAKSQQVTIDPSLKKNLAPKILSQPKVCESCSC